MKTQWDMRHSVRPEGVAGKRMETDSSLDAVGTGTGPIPEPSGPYNALDSSGEERLSTSVPSVPCSVVTVAFSPDTTVETTPIWVSIHLSATEYV